MKGISFQKVTIDCKIYFAGDSKHEILTGLKKAKNEAYRISPNIYHIKVLDELIKITNSVEDITELYVDDNKKLLKYKVLLSDLRVTHVEVFKPNSGYSNYGKGYKIVEDTSANADDFFVKMIKLLELFGKFKLVDISPNSYFEKPEDVLERAIENAEMNN